MMPTLCSSASASLLFLSRSESSWPPEDPPPASTPRFESPYRMQDKLKTKQQPGGSSSIKLHFCSRHLHPSFSSLLLFSSFPLESGRFVVSSSPVQPSAHSCQTYCRKKRICYRTVRRPSLSCLDSLLRVNMLNKSRVSFIYSHIMDSCNLSISHIREQWENNLGVRLADEE